MRFRHNLTGNNTVKRVVSFLLMLCLLVPMLPSSIGLDAKAEDNTTTESTESTDGTITITLHDLYIDRKEALPDNTELDNCLLAYESARTITVEKGTTLNEIFQEAGKADADPDLKKNTTLGTSSLEKTGVYKEGTEDKNAMTSVIDASKCIWYTRDGGTNGGVDGNNVRNKFNFDTKIDDNLTSLNKEKNNLDLYTYSYRIRLITGKNQYNDLIVREGQTSGFISGAGREKEVSIKDFLSKNEVDDNWTDVNEGTKADTSALEKGITRNYAFRASDVDKNEITIPCYASVNETWKQVGEIKMDTDRVDVWGRTGPALNYYVTDDELVSVYGKEYGFNKDMLQQQTEISKVINGYFPFRNGGNMTIRQLPKWTSEGQFRIPLVEDTTTDVSQLEIYYTPHNTTEYTSNFLEYEQNDTQHNNRYGWASIIDSAVLQDNSFYTVSIDESDKDKFNSSELLDAKLLRGESGSFKLPLKDKGGNPVSWYVEKGGDNVKIVDNSNDTSTVTVDRIDSQLILTTDKNKEYAGDVQVHCYVLINGKPQEVGNLHTHATSKNNWGQDKSYNKYYVTAKQAAIVYGKYGFDVSKFDPNTNQQQKYIFANTKHNDTTIWMDLVPCDSGDGMGYKIPLLAGDSSEKHMDLYYVPNNAKSGSATVSGTSADSTFVQKNSFYSVTVKDEASEFKNSQLPETQYVLYGGTAEVTVPSSESATWSIWNCFLDGNPVNEHNKGDISSSSANGQITYTVKNICRPILVTTSTEHKEVFDTDNYVKITPYIAIDGKWVKAETDIQGIDKTHISYNEEKNKNYYYITSEELQNIYGQYGFDASKVTTTGKLYQIGCQAGTELKVIWSDNTPVETDASWILPLVGRDSTEIQLYYLPNNTDQEHYGSQKPNPVSNYTRAQAAAQNTFYSINVEDTTGLLDKDPTLTKKQYVLAGKDKSITLPYDQKTPWTVWYCSANGDLKPVEKAISNVTKKVDKDTITITLSKVSNPILITTNTTYEDNLYPIKAFIAINGQWQRVETELTGLNKEHITSDKKYYITAEELEFIYGKYGFQAADNSVTDKNRIFGIGNGETDSIWADVLAENNGDSWYYPTLGDGKELCLYYLPNNIEGKDGFWGYGEGNAGGKSKDKALAANTFYTIDFVDSDDKFPDATLPDTQYALTGTDKTVTLPYAENVNWFRDSKKLTPDSIDKENGTAKYTISNVTQATKITTDGVSDGEVAVQGYISLNGKWTKLSSMSIKTAQTDSDKFYLTSAQLETLFGSCGFKASDYAKTSENDLSKYFPSSTIGADTISTTAGGKNTNGSWQVNTIETKDREQGIAVYYTPAGVDNFSTTDTTVLSRHTFYTITITDDGGKFNSSNVEIPSKLYRQAGKVTIMLPDADGVNWTVWSTATNDNKTESALNVTQKVNDENSSVELTFCMHSDLTVKTNGSKNLNQIKLEAYISLDDAWTCIKNTTISKSNWNGEKFYITDEELKDLYKAYGFTGLKEGTYSFGIATKYKDKSNTRNDDSMWPDQCLTVDKDGNRYLPLAEAKYFTNREELEKNIIKLYYLPQNTNKQANGITIKDGSDFAKPNTFYTITLKDPGNKNFTEDELSEKSQIVLNGDSTTITLPYKKGVTWKVTDKNGVLQSGLASEENDDTTVTLKISSVTQPLIATTESTVTANLPNDQIAVNAYVSIDDEWTPVATEWTYENNKFVGDNTSFTVSKSQVTDDKRYYLTANQLQSIFSEYGLSVSDINGKSGNHFPHSTIRYKDSTSNTIYADTTPFKTEGGSWCVPFIKTDDGEQGISIYYTPKTTKESCLKTDQTTLSENCFKYSMSAANPLNVDDVTLPKTEIFNKGEEASLTLPKAPNGYQWIAVNKKTGVKIVGLIEKENDDGSITYSTSSITQPIQFILSENNGNGQVIIQYTANLEDSDREPLGNLFRNVADQVIKEDGAVEKQAVFAETVTAEQFKSYTTRAPDSDRVKITATEHLSGKRDEPRDYYYTFKGWQIEGTDKVIDSKADLSKVIGEDIAIVKLNANWEALDNQKRPNTVNFYLSLSCEIMDNVGNGFNGQAKENFTTTIYSTRIKGTDGLEVKEDTDPDPNVFRILAPASNESLAYQNDSIMREAVNKPITRKTTDAIESDNQLTLDDFPSDETILKNLRERVDDTNDETTVKIEGKTIPSEYLTTEYFAVRWYVLKYNNADAWHIDGVLVAKRAHAVITKTFAGDKDAIAEVKKKYQISITHDDINGNGTQQDYVLTLNSAADEEHANHFGYTSYDEATDTYTWVLTGRQGRTYTAKEISYKTPDAQKYHGTYQYMIKNSENSDTSDWTNYPEEKGVSLIAQAYVDGSPTDSYQTVSFRNIYTSAGSISISKIDAATGFGLKDVEFTITNTKSGDSSPMKLYQKMENGVETSYYADESGTSYTKEVSSVKTDANGMLYVKLSEGTYILTEIKPPTGYDGPSTITITVDGNGRITDSQETHDRELQLKSTSDQWVIVSGENNATLTIKNTSKILLTVTAKKEWLDTDKKSVTVSLYRNGVKMAGDEYTQELNDKNLWSYTWKNLPLYVDDAVAEYSLREEKIGDTAYEPDNGSNGYRDYLVEYEPTKYLETLGNDNTNPVDANWQNAQTNAIWTDNDGTTHYAQHALLVVKNKTAQSDIIFKKTDSLGNDLAGAIFGIYSDEDCTKLVSTSESDKQGYVRFTSKSMDEEHYAYIKEIQAPSGCTMSDTVYRVTIPENHENGREDDITFEKQVSGKNGFTYESADTITDSDGNKYVVAKNSSHINLQIKKVDNTGNPLTGAEFHIEKLNMEDGTYKDFGKGTYTVENTDGVVEITGDNGKPLTLLEGTYRITETKTPSSLYRNAGKIIVTVQGGQVYYDKESSDDDSTDIDSWKMEQKNGTVTYTLQVANTPWWSLPSTGGSGILLPIIFGSALMCGASALALWLRKRRKNG